VTNGSVTTEDRPDQRVAPGRARSSPLLRPAAAVVALAALAASGHAAAWLSAVTLLVAYRLSDRRHSVLACLPAAVLACAVGLVAVLTLAGELELQILSSSDASRALLAALSLTLVPLLVPRRRMAGRWAERGEVVACLPAVALAVVGAWLGRQALPDAVGGMLVGWDSGAHTLASAAMARTGDLSYDANAYPRGLHALVSLVVNARGALEATPEHLGLLLRTQSAAVWVLHVLLTATVALVTLRLGLLRQLTARTATATALGAGLLTLSPFVFNFTMVYGFHTSIALALVLATVTLELLSRRAPEISTVLLAAAVTATAHTYQLALPVVAVPLLLRVVTLARAGSVGWPVLAAGVPLALAAWPPAWSVVVNTGVGTVGADGVAGPLPTVLLWLGLGCTAWLGWRCPEPWARLLASTVLALLAVAVVSAWLAGASLDDYYPRKLLWHVVVLTLPVTATALAAGLLRLRERTRDVAFVRLSSTAGTILVAIVVTALAVPGPYMAASGGWSLPSGVVTALVHPEDERVACSLESKFARQVVFRLLHFYEPVPAPPPPTVALLPDCPEPPSED
jgi:hypothetical protein